MALRREVFTAAAILTAAALASVILREYMAATNIAMLYLLAVVTVSATCGRKVSVAASFVSVAAFDFLCVPPYHRLAVTDYEYVVMFGGMLAVSLVISTQTGKLKEFALQSGQRVERTDALYRLSRTLAQETRVFEAARAAADLTEQVLHTRVVIFLPRLGRIQFDRRTSEDLPIPAVEESAAQEVFESGRRPADRDCSSDRLSALYLPLCGAGQPLGIMALLRDAQKRLPARETIMLAEVFATQIALAMERIASQSAAEESRFRIRTEEMRSSLLSAVSHDLRTPLAAITGSASTLREEGDRLAPETRVELIDSIAEEAERLGRLVNNLLDMTRFESGAAILRREHFPLEEIVGAALQRLEGPLAGRSVLVDLPDDLPLVFGDDVLLGQVLWNLLENATKYTPPQAAIEIAAHRKENTLLVEVRDRGPGVRQGDEDQIFEKFYRGQRIYAGAPTPQPGAGLGLPICRAIVEAHGGTIQVLAREGGGAVFQIQLPLEGVPA